MAADLTVTALYTSATWAWARFPGADLLLTWQARLAFALTNAVMGLSRWLRPDVPSLRESLVARHRLLDQLASESGAATTVELAAGLSPRGLASAGRYVEVDLPSMIALKDQLLARTERGRAALSNPALTRVGADVREVDLSSLAGPGSVCVIVEGLLMYLDADAQRLLWRRIATWLAGHPGSVLLFDLVPACEQPPPGRIGRALAKAMAAATKGGGFVRDDRTRADLVRELRECGFSTVEALEPDRGPIPTQVVVFRCVP